MTPTKLKTRLTKLKQEKNLRLKKFDEKLIRLKSSGDLNNFTMQFTLFYKVIDAIASAKDVEQFFMSLERKNLPEMTIRARGASLDLSYNLVGYIQDEDRESLIDFSID